MVLEISGDAGDAGDGTAPSFAAALWEGAVSRDVAAWIGGHGAKVVAAIVKSGDAATRKACIAALTKALPKGQSPTTWAEGFFRQRAEGTKETKETKETKKAPETKARASSKTPAPSQKKTSKSADENAATPSAARVSKSPKDKKFSPRLTRAQRSEKAAKGKK
jgi:pumilio family protein 6